MDFATQLLVILSIASIVVLPMAAFQIGKRLHADLVGTIVAWTGVVSLAPLSSYGLYHNALHLGFPLTNAWLYGVVLYALAIGLGGYMGGLDENERRGALLKAASLLVALISSGGAIAAFIL